MNQTTTLARIQEEHVPAVSVGFDTLTGFEALQRMANLFSASSIVPEVYRSKGEKDYASRGNCVIALDMALRMGANPLMVMQNLYVVHGRPAWSAQFLIATLNQSGKFSALRYEFQGEEGNDDWGCRAVATELATKERLAGPLITIGLAKKEGWYNKTGSKWQTMPELMLRYRAAAWFVRAYAPEIAMGLQTVEEVHDVIDLTDRGDGLFGTEDSPRKTMTTSDIADMIQKESPAKQAQGKRTSTKAKSPEPAPQPTEPVPADEPPFEPDAERAAAPASMPPSSDLIECPVRGGSMIDDWECAGCAHRQGCPSWD